MTTISELREAIRFYTANRNMVGILVDDAAHTIADCFTSRDPITMDFWSSLKPKIPADARAFMHLHLGEGPEDPILWAMQSDVDSSGVIKTVVVSAVSYGMEDLKRPLHLIPRTMGDIYRLLEQLTRE
jgi:hypothetical protein